MYADSFHCSTARPLAQRISAVLLTVAMSVVFSQPAVAFGQETANPPPGSQPRTAPPPAPVGQPVAQPAARPVGQPPPAPAPRARSDYWRRPRVIRDWRPGEPVPDGYRVVSRPRTGLAIGGGCLFGALYISSVVIATAVNDANDGIGDDDNISELYVPLLGPFLALGKSETSTGDLLLTINGIGQTAGAAMLVAGLVARRKYLVLQDYGSNGHIQIMPFGGAGTSGLSLSGAF